MTTSGSFPVIAGGPGSHLPRDERRLRRAAIRSLRARADGDPEPPRTVLLCEPAPPYRLAVHANRRWWRWMARLLGPGLDHRLAVGRPPESRRLLAARAQVLVAPATRLTLAHQWIDLLAQARAPRAGRDPRVPVNRAGLVANEPEIRALLDVLASPAPVPVRGIASMSRLLTDGSGPVYLPQPADGLREVLHGVSALFASPPIFTD